jgi:hypothetical protein
VKKEVLVLDKDKRFLSYCHPARARQLLRDGNAKVYSRVPFAIQLVRSINLEKVDEDNDRKANKDS